MLHLLLTVISASRILGSQTPHLSIVFIPASFAPADRYTDLLTSIQSESTSIAICIAESNESINDNVRGCITDLRELNKDTPLAIMSHSDSTIAATRFITDYPNVFAGQVVFGATVDSSPEIPVLVINGEYDGVVRPMESAVLSARSNQLMTVVIGPGLTHLSFITGPVQFNQEDLDTKLLNSHTGLTGDSIGYISSVVVDFLNVYYTRPKDLLVSQRRLDKHVSTTREFAAPMIKALQLEGSLALGPQCDSDLGGVQCPFYPVYPAQSTRNPGMNVQGCQCGSPFAKLAQGVLMPVSNSGVYSVDAVHIAADLNPVHHPHIWNACNGLKCTLNVTTVTEILVEKGWTSASELRMKLKSTQSLIKALTGKTVDMRLVDTNMTCARVNQLAYDTGLALLPISKRRFYEVHGVPMEFANDADVGAMYPVWMTKALGFSLEKREDSPVLTVTSASYLTDVDYWLPVEMFKGMHYCKVLSPARVVEWAYTDSLRHKFGYVTAKLNAY